MSEKRDYLKPKQHYVDQYDLFTIQRCLDVVRFWQEKYRNRHETKEVKDLPEKELEKGFNHFLHWNLYAVKASKFKRKQETIEEWMERDRIEQDKHDNTPVPENILCPDCNQPMENTTRLIEGGIHENEPLRVLFCFKCTPCDNFRSIYEDGEEDLPTPTLCPKCNKEVKVEYSSKDKVITTITNCENCGYSNTEIDDLGKRQKERAKKEKEEAALLEKYRDEFCLSEKEGKEHVETIEAIKVANVVCEEEKQKYEDPVYERSLQLKKTKISDLEKILVEKLEKAKYTKLMLEKPEIGQHVIVSFTIQDDDPNRDDRDSRSELEKLIKDALEDTNWRLVSNTVTYRLGYLEGQLQGYESEEDLLKLAGKMEKPKPKSKVSEEMKSKYSHHNLVQLARLFGQHDGVENMRKRRLQKEPDGFSLDKKEGPYTCGICGETTPGEKTWWNLDGLRCADCHRNIEEGVIPTLSSRYSDDSEYFQNWQIQSDYGVHPATRAKLKRDCVLVGRDLKREDGLIYCTIYLKDENKEFLKKHPRKPDK